jgi:hypothetical protein
MEAEHSVIDPMLAACAAGFAAMASAPDAETRDRLGADTEQARDTLSDHMGHEEREALPLVQELLSTEGWQRVEKAAGAGKGLKDLMFLAPWIADGLTPEQFDTVVGMLGKPFQWMVAMTRGRYARGEAVAFRYC